MHLRFHSRWGRYSNSAFLDMKTNLIHAGAAPASAPEIWSTHIKNWSNAPILNGGVHAVILEKFRVCVSLLQPHSSMKLWSFPWHCKQHSLWHMNGGGYHRWKAKSSCLYPKCESKAPRCGLLKSVWCTTRTEKKNRECTDKGNLHCVAHNWGGFRGCDLVRRTQT